MNTMEYDVSKVCSPSNMGSYGWECFQMIADALFLHIWSSNIIFFSKTSLLFHSCYNAPFFHQSSCFLVWPMQAPWESSATIPWMLYIHPRKIISDSRVSLFHRTDIIQWCSSNTKKLCEQCLFERTDSLILTITFCDDRSYQIGLLHLFFSRAPPQRWVLKWYGGGLLSLVPTYVSQRDTKKWIFLWCLLLF